MRGVKSARTAEPDLDEEDILALTATNSGLSLRLVRIAVRYWASHADEIDAEIAAAAAAEAAAEEAWLRERQHAGLLLISTKRFPQDRSFSGAVVEAIASLLSTPAGIGPDRVVFLRR